MAKILKWGLLSTARINRRLIPAIRAARGHKLVAVASRDFECARKYARQWGIPTAYGTYEELLDDPQIDVIYNSLPNHLHAAWSIRAAEKGKHVLCEKPLALSPQEVDEIITAANQHQVVIAEAFMYRHHPRTLKIQELVSSGAIGEICHINSAYTIQFGRPENYRWQPEAGGGSLWDIGCYPVSFTHLMMGTLPKEVYGVADQASSGVDSAFTGLLSYGSGATVRFFCSFKLPYSSRLEIQGSEGTIITESPFVPKRNQPIYLHQAGRTRKINTSMPRLLYQGEVEDLGQAVNTGASQRLPLSESREINQILSSLHVSALKGIPIKLQ